LQCGKLGDITSRRAFTVLAILAVAFAVTHALALFTDAFNWDEFALLHRAQHAVLTGELQTGGRPGLGVVVLVPFVDGCRHHAATLIGARILWCVITFALVAGAFDFLRRATRGTDVPWHAATLGTAAFVLVPLFLRWSLQVRTDQPAVAAAIWAGAALLASRDKPRWSVVAGLLLGTGYLFSQKAVYIGALVGVVALGQLYIDGAFEWRREVRRAGGLAIGAGVALGLYKIIVPLVWSPPRAVALDVGLNLLDWYKTVLRYRLYPSMVTSVLPQLALVVLVFVAAIRAFRLQTAERKPLLVALATLLLGYGVGRFHTASFPYFWITIGIFPATGIALGWQGIRALLPRGHRVVGVAALVVMLALAVRYRAETLVDTQETQRYAFAFVEQLPPTWRGFHADGGLVCRKDPSPFRVYLGQDIQHRLFEGDIDKNRREFIGEFVSRPVAFVVRTQRFGGFPDEIRTFWKRHYVPYAGPVELAGTKVEGGSESTRLVEIIVPGTYRWHSETSRIAVDGMEVVAGGTVELAAGQHAVTLHDASMGGFLALAVHTPPRRNATPFYDKMFWVELAGVRRDWWW
jgi:hypothetical protein